MQKVGPRRRLRFNDRVLEYVDHLHEHFHTPVTIRDGRYMPPQAPGLSTEMFADSPAAHEYPHGSARRVQG